MEPITMKHTENGYVQKIWFSWSVKVNFLRVSTYEGKNIDNDKSSITKMNRQVFVLDTTLVHTGDK